MPHKSSGYSNATQKFRIMKCYAKVPDIEMPQKVPDNEVQHKSSGYWSVTQKFRILKCHTKVPDIEMPHKSS